MKFATLAKRNILRYKDIGVIGLGDIVLVAIMYLLADFLLSAAARVGIVLSKVILDQQQFYHNPSIINLNVALFQQATFYTVSAIIISSLVFALSYAIISYVQWTYVAKKELSFTHGKWFVLVQSIYVAAALLFLATCIFYLFDPDKTIIAVIVYLILFVHFLYGLHIGLIQHAKTKSFWAYVQSGFKPAVTHGFTWLVSYGLLFVIGFASLIMLGFLAALATPGLILAGLIFLYLAGWWRMILYDLIAKDRKL